eukprot:TRINITY_DN4422_c0_g1_i11.p1 TRINITY_DN4422_c0_g1~~TRINITY_DN4422_c0_g1_i11.p1  ORF type:complete len:208 (+),score=51.83 TRINITY_DN4422_c0_g1_i11:545-1168(+)
MCTSSDVSKCALATIVNAISHIPNHVRVETILFQGAGLLGLYGCAFCKKKGIPNIFCSDVLPNRLELVEKFGGIPIVSRGTEGPETINSLKSRTVDVVVEVSGVVNCISEAVELLRPGGVLITVGLVHPNSKLEITAEQIIRKCLTIIGIHNYSPKNLSDAVRFMNDAGNEFPWEEMISPTPFPLCELEWAIEVAKSQKFCRVCVVP